MAKKYTMNLWSVTSLGIGSMVGAGIFALLGQATLSAGREVVLSFFFSGIVALLSAYSYSKLAAKYPSSGGILDYYTNAFHSKITSTALSIIYLLTLAVSIAMLAKAFGTYLIAMLHFTESTLFWSNVFAILIVLFLYLLNMIGSSAVGKAEGIIVALKLSILVVLLIAGMLTLDFTKISAEPNVTTTKFFGTMGLTFFAFAGFGMMTNASAEVKNPAKTIPLAIFLAIIIVMFLYIFLAIVVLGNLSTEQLSKNPDIALAEAARPILSDLGFFIVSFAALLATSSGINAMFFSAMRIVQSMASKHQLPSIFNHKFWNKNSYGFALSVFGIIILLLLFDLRAIANIASISFLVCYLAVFVANWRLRKETKSLSIVIILGFLAMLLILFSFVLSLAYISPQSLLFSAIFFAVSILAAFALSRK